MDPERLPLLPQPSCSSQNTDESSIETIASTTFSTFRVPIYGSDSRLPVHILKPEKRVTYTWKHINVFSRNQKDSNKRRLVNFLRRRTESEFRKHILINVSGAAYPGELLAILGSSGAGKTSLLNALTFRSRHAVVTGVRCINGQPVTPNAFVSQSAYVQQDDLFIGSLTVKEHLVFQALVRMDKDISYRNRLRRVDEVIQELALTKCKDTQIGIPGRIKGISGGEMKRLSFAAEVLTNPSLMFCDEPTSGLDSFMALNVMQVLKQMTLAGKTVICTIHQPSSELYALFDKLLLMAEGRVAFSGSPEEADVFFREMQAYCPKNYNPADYFIQLLAVVPGREESCREAINYICDKYDSSRLGKRFVNDTHLEAKNERDLNDVWFNGGYVKNPYKASWCAQFRAVLWRSWLSVIKEPLLMKVRLLQTIIVSLLIGVIYYGQMLDQDGVMNINGVLFLFLTNMTFQNVMAVTNVFCAEHTVFLREHRSGMYRVDVYFLCKTFAETPIFVAIPIVFVSVSYFLIGLNPDVYRFLLACGIMVLVCNVATSYGYLISCASANVSMALSIAPPVIIPFMLFGGFFLNIRSIPFYFHWLSYLSWFKYGNEALMVNQWGGVKKIDCLLANTTCPSSGHVILKMYNFHEEHLLWDLVALTILIIGLRILAYFALLIKSYVAK